MKKSKALELFKGEKYKKSVYLNKLKTSVNKLKWNLKHLHKINIEGIKQNELIRLFANYNNLPLEDNENLKVWLLKLYITQECEFLLRNKDGFYGTPEWKKLRLRVINYYTPVCMKCSSKEDICVDHIKPRSKFPETELNFDNMQILCNTCNLIKSNKDFTDYRGNKKALELLHSKA